MKDAVLEQPVIEAERFKLRPLRRSDAGLIGLYASDERLARMTSRIPHPLPPGQTEAYLARATAPDRSEDVWAIDGTAIGRDEVLGVVSLKRLDRRQSEVGYWVAPALWNTGIASEAVSAMVEANPHEVDTLFAEVFQDNPGSARVLTNCGFDYLGDAETYSVARRATVPTWTYSRRMQRA
ncbi:GNAT family N-acetyltransferase [Roseitranquillus sediminis]|uniref:GNAT family N-acetyltransferase n=1 Tax=Roseitranquillus sediminis TaxID=2809051 RepID=UPI001D0C5FD1|nr:GNAT family N-acetyltransferase [Roseitranquillus sediminis]MBM9595512.1 GNAT family N-acetyltransferase [Roseitranquillus sediminis]